MSMKTKIKGFFDNSRQYVVAGASANPSKFGFKILSWYVSHDLPVIPVNPKEPEILGQTVAKTVTEVMNAVVEHKDIAHHKLANVNGISISFLTPPHVTLQTLSEIGDHPKYLLLIKGLWFQPGSYDEQVLLKAQELGLYDKTIQEDECILVRGEEGLYSANL